MRFLSPLCIGLLLLSSCGGSPVIAPDDALTHPAAAETLTARMALRIVEEKGNRSTVGIVLLNPANMPIRSVRAWVRFDPATTRVEDFTVADGRFVLFAPGERMVDTEEGFIKFGGAVQAPIAEREVLVATFTARILPGAHDAPPMLSFYDWRPGGDGHTAVLSLPQDLPREERDSLPPDVLNIVEPPSSLAL